MSLREFYRDAVINTAAASLLVPGHLRWVLLRLYGVQIARAYVGGRCWFGGAQVAIGRGSYINRGTFFDGLDSITIGSRVHIGMQVMILTGSHGLGSAECRAGALRSAPVVVGDGCWIGARAVVMPGVTIGSGSVIAAGAVVTEDCQPDGLYAGVPARRVRELADRTVPARANR